MNDYKNTISGIPLLDEQKIETASVAYLNTIECELKRSIDRTRAIICGMESFCARLLGDQSIPPHIVEEEVPLTTNNGALTFLLNDLAELNSKLEYLERLQENFTQIININK